jgi:hypothetical protein
MTVSLFQVKREINTTPGYCPPRVTFVAHGPRSIVRFAEIYRQQRLWHERLLIAGRRIPRFPIFGKATFVANGQSEEILLERSLMKRREQREWWRASGSEFLGGRESKIEIPNKPVENIASHRGTRSGGALLWNVPGSKGRVSVLRAN